MMNAGHVVVSDVMQAIRDRSKVNPTLSGSTEEEIMSCLFESISARGPNTDLFYIQKQQARAAISHGLLWQVLESREDKFTGNTLYNVKRCEDEESEYKLLNLQCMADFGLKREFSKGFTDNCSVFDREMDQPRKPRRCKRSLSISKEYDPVRTRQAGKRKNRSPMNGDAIEDVNRNDFYEDDDDTNGYGLIFRKCVEEFMKEHKFFGKFNTAGDKETKQNDSEECLENYVTDFLIRRVKSRNEKLKCREKSLPEKAKRLPMKRKLMELNIMDDNEHVRKFMKSSASLSKDRFRASHFSEENDKDHEYGLAYRKCHDSKKLPKRGLKEAKAIILKEDRANAKKNGVNRRGRKRVVKRMRKRSLSAKGRKATIKPIRKRQILNKIKGSTKKKVKPCPGRKSILIKRIRKPQTSSDSERPTKRTRKSYESSDSELSTKEKTKPKDKKASPKKIKAKRQKSSGSDRTTNSTKSRSNSSVTDYSTERSDRRSFHTGSSSAGSTTTNYSKFSSNTESMYDTDHCRTDYFDSFAKGFRYQEFYDDGKDDFMTSDDDDDDDDYCERRPRNHALNLPRYTVNSDTDSKESDDKRSFNSMDDEDVYHKICRYDGPQRLVKKLVKDLGGLHYEHTPMNTLCDNGDTSKDLEHNQDKVTSSYGIANQITNTVSNLQKAKQSSNGFSKKSKAFAKVKKINMEEQDTTIRSQEIISTPARVHYGDQTKHSENIKTDTETNPDVSCKFNLYTDIQTPLLPVSEDLPHHLMLNTQEMPKRLDLCDVRTPKSLTRYIPKPKSRQKECVSKRTENLIATEEMVSVVYVETEMRNRVTSEEVPAIDEVPSCSKDTSAAGESTDASTSSDTTKGSAKSEAGSDHNKATGKGAEVVENSPDSNGEKEKSSSEDIGDLAFNVDTENQAKGNGDGE